MTRGAAALVDAAEVIEQVRDAVPRHLSAAALQQLLAAVGIVREACDQLEAQLRQADAAPRGLLVSAPRYPAPAPRRAGDPPLQVTVPARVGLNLQTRTDGED